MTFLDAWPKVAYSGNVNAKFVMQYSKQFICRVECFRVDAAWCCQAEHFATQSLVLIR